MKSTNPTHLPPDHRRSISTTAQIVEKAVKEMKDILREKGDATQNYSEEQTARILEKIDALAQSNRELFQEFDLQHSVSSQSQMLRAKAAYLWTVLMDSKSKKLSRFGKLSHDPAAELDKHIDRMLSLLDILSKHL